MIKIFYFFKKFIFKFFFVFYLKFAINFLFYFNPDYLKSPYIKDNKRRLKKSKFSWEKVWEVRNDKIAHTYADPIDNQIYTKEELQERITRFDRHEVLSFPLVWQPDIVDEKDDWRYRRSFYLKRGILRIVLFSKWETSNLSDVQKTVHLTKVFGTILLTPIFIWWVIYNRMEILHTCIHYVLLNEYMLNKIGLKDDTVYSLVVRSYYTNYINQVVDYLIAYTNNLEAETLKAFNFIGLTPQSKNILYIKRGIHNFMVVNKIITEMVHYYNRNELDDFICKEILTEYTRRQKINMEKAELYYKENAGFIQKTVDWCFDIFRYYKLSFKVPFLDGINVAFCSGVSQIQINSGSRMSMRHSFCYKKDDELALWAFENALFHDWAWRPLNWWRYDFAGGAEAISYIDRYHPKIPLNNFPTLIEEIRQLNCRYIYPTDLAIFGFKKVYEIMKPKDNSFFWTVVKYLDKNLNVSRKDHRLNKLFDLAIKPVAAWYLDVVNSKNRFVSLLKNSFLGSYLFLEQRPGDWKNVRSKKNVGEIYSEWIAGNNRLFNGRPYELVHKGGDAYFFRHTVGGIAIGFGYVPSADMGPMMPLSNHYNESVEGLLSRQNMEDEYLTLHDYKRHGVSFSTLDIFWADYDLSINMFANLISLNLFIDFLSIIFLFHLFIFNVKSIKVYNSYIVKKVYFFFEIYLKI